MEYLQVAVCDDSIDEQNKLQKLISEANMPVETTIFNSGEDLLKDYMPSKYDLIFMDIYMEGVSGIETVTTIREVDENVLIAFATTSMDHTLESYRLGAIKYIEKPIKKDSVNELLDMAQMKMDRVPKLLIKNPYKDFAIAFENILYVEQKAHNLLFHLINGDVMQFNEKLSNIENLFVEHPFLHCHKSYLVNLSYVKGIDTKLRVFNMKYNKNVYIRRGSLGQAKKEFEKHLFKMARKNGGGHE